MKKLTMLFVAFLPLILFATPVPTVSADGQNQSDHMLISAPDVEHGYCGVGKKGEPWELHLAYSPSRFLSGTSGTLTIGFRDGSSIPFPVAADSSFSLTQAMGGVPGVDDLVRIDITAGLAWVSARAQSGARDPFTEPVPEKDNFCINIPAEQAPNTVTVTLPGPLPPAWDAVVPGHLN